MTSHVPSLEWCKRLKACGFPQKTKFWYKRWVHNYGDPREYKPGDEYIFKLDYGDRGNTKDFEVYAAPIATELMEELPDWGENRSIYVFCDCGTYFVQYREWGFGKVIADFNDDYLCNALSAMYEHLAKGGLLK